ncbi:MAG: alpha/beta fold hydrolase [bacterium]
MLKKDFTLLAVDGFPLRVTTYGTDKPLSAPVLVFTHGFKGFKDWGFVPPLGEYFSAQGFFVVTFNFSHNGVGTNPTEFDRLDLFERNTFSREVSELTQVVQAVRGGQLGRARQAPLGVIGHSRGGAIALLTAAMLAEIGAVATWSAVSHLDRYSASQVVLWREQGYLEAVNQRTKQVMRLGLDLLEDIEQHGDGSLSVEKAVRSLAKPLLVIHGHIDDGVPVREAEELYSWADQISSELLVIPEAGHTFGVVHPWAGSTPAFDLVLDRTASFFRERLG